MSAPGEADLVVEILNGKCCLTFQGTPLLEGCNGNARRLFRALVEQHGRLLAYADLEREVFGNEPHRQQGAYNTKNAVAALRAALFPDDQQRGGQKWARALTAGSDTVLILEKPNAGHIRLQLPQPAGSRLVYLDWVEANPARPNLPGSVSPFIGRQREIAELKSLLARTRLLTITGAGGSGKTRLALKIGQDLQARFQGGVWLVELGAVHYGEFVDQAVAKTLSVRETPGRPMRQSIIDAVGQLTGSATRDMLLIIDNCEQIIADCAALIDAMLSHCPTLCVLATSRESLNLPGETIWQAPALELPAEDALPGAAWDLRDLERCDAVRLFMERATSQRPDFTLTQQNASDIVHTCRRLDALPLAIELAAACVRFMPVTQIARRLDRRFDLLTRGSRFAMPQHQTLRGTMDWSYDLLTENERVLLNRLSVFQATWSLEEAQSVCGEGFEKASGVFEPMARLVEKSLIEVDHAHDQARCCMLETVRQYARERLEATGELECTSARHYDFLLSWASEASNNWNRACMERAIQLLPEVRAALAWCARRPGGGVPGLKLAQAMHHFWHLHGHLTEGRRHIEAALRHPGAQEETMARCNALSSAGVLAMHMQDYPAAASLLQESLEIARQHHDRRAISRAVNNLGNVEQSQGRHQAALRLFEESLQIDRELGDPMAQAIQHLNIGSSYAAEHEYDWARQAFNEALRIHTRSGYPHRARYPLIGLAWLELTTGSFTVAKEHFQASFQHCEAIGDRLNTTDVLDGLAATSLYLGDTARALRLLGACRAMRRSLGTAPTDRAKQETEAVLCRAAEQLGRAEVQEAIELGEALTAAEVAALVAF